MPDAAQTIISLLQQLVTMGGLPTGGLLTSGDSQTLEDEETIELNSSINGLGEVWLSDYSEHGKFFINSSGEVTLLETTGNISDSDEDGKLCIYDGGTGGIIKNRLGSSKVVKYFIMY